jgi:multidrug resistance efflux pump
VADSLTLLPAKRADLRIRQVADDSFVVRTADASKYFSFGREEAFLFERLDGEHSAEDICKEYEREFGESVEESDVLEFVESLERRQLLQGTSGTEGAKAQSRSPDSDDDEEEDDALPTKGRFGGSLLFYRIRLFDPDAGLTRWEPLLRWVWTPAFLAISAGMMLWALLIVWSNRADLVASFPGAMRWETAVLVFATLILSTALHEFAHGLTCKHFGGEVREIGVLFVFFLPCLYCNVSDAWMIRERWKRLTITAAGGYLDLCQWAIAVFVWRLTVPGCLLNYLAFVVMTVCGGRGFINFNPLLRLDGYYLLSDALNIQNLRSRARDYWMGHVRWLMWGAKRPVRDPNGVVLLSYGILNWSFALVFLQIVTWKMIGFAGNDFGWYGFVLPTILLAYALRRVFRGAVKGEFTKMVVERPDRWLKWGGGILIAVGILFIFPVKHYSNGEFEVRPGQVTHVHVPATGVVTKVFVEDGARVNPGDPLVQLTSPEVDVQLAAKESELVEVDAGLAKLRLGPRREELEERRQQIARLEEWVRIGAEDLAKAKDAHAQELLILEHRVKEAEQEAEFAKKTVEQAEKLQAQGALAGLQLRSEQKELSILQSRAAQAKAALEATKVQGTRESQSDLIRRERELADVRASLRLLEAGTRPEEIAAEEARRERINSQVKFLRNQRERLLVRASTAGVVSTPRMQEKIGDLVTPGLLLCTIENASTTHVEIAVPEEDSRHLQTGLPVRLKARSLPFQTFTATVDRISTVTNRETTTAKNRVTVHCRLDNESGLLKSGMSGLGSIQHGWNTAGIVLVTGMLRYLRTEFWW